MEKPSFTLIGAGNVASHYGKALVNAGYCIKQVFSRTYQSARALADTLDAQPITSFIDLDGDADIYIVAITDEYIARLVPLMCRNRQEKLFVHTAGSVDTHVFQGHTRCYGVLYPLQTLSKQRDIPMRNVPLFTDASDADTEQLLTQMAHDMGATAVAHADSTQRMHLHLAAVFAANFTNHCYAIAQQQLEEQQMPYQLLLPLINETAAKVSSLPPTEAQTGPAKRGDRATMQKHLALLQQQPAARKIYQLISRDITERANGGKEEDTQE